jgi:hypothetical protein
MCRAFSPWICFLGLFLGWYVGAPLALDFGVWAEGLHPMGRRTWADVGTAFFGWQNLKDCRQGVPCDERECKWCGGEGVDGQDQSD